MHESFPNAARLDAHCCLPNHTFQLCLRCAELLRLRLWLLSQPLSQLLMHLGQRLNQLSMHLRQLFRPLGEVFLVDVEQEGFARSVLAMSLSVLDHIGAMGFARLASRTVSDERVVSMLVQPSL